jgi:hypothetical protein
MPFQYVWNRLREKFEGLPSEKGLRGEFLFFIWTQFVGVENGPWWLKISYGCLK